MEQVIFSNTTVGAANSGTQYIHPWSSQAAVWTSTQSTFKTKMFNYHQTAKIRNFTIEVGTAPGAGKNWAFEIWKNNATTGLSVTIADANTSGSNGTVEVNFDVNDYIQLRSVPTGTPTAHLYVSWSFVLETNGNFYYWFGANNNGVPSGSTGYNWPVAYNNVPVATTEAARRFGIPHSCTLTDGYLTLDASPGASRTRLFSIYKNGVEEASTRMSFTGTDTAKQFNNASVSLTTSDYLTLPSVPTGTPAAATMQSQLVFKPAVEGESSVVLSPITLSTTAVTYVRPFYPYTTGSTTTEYTSIVPINTDIVIYNFYVTISAAPGTGGSGKTRTFNIRKNTANANNSVLISETATSGSDTASIDKLTANDYLSIATTPANTPAAANSRMAFVCFMLPKTRFLISD